MEVEEQTQYLIDRAKSDLDFKEKDAIKASIFAVDTMFIYKPQATNLTDKEKGFYIFWGQVKYELQVRLFNYR